MTKKSEGLLTAQPCLWRHNADGATLPPGHASPCWPPGGGLGLKPHPPPPPPCLAPLQLCRCHSGGPLHFVPSVTSSSFVLRITARTLCTLVGCWEQVAPE
jgi:hypothetical protein